MILEELFHDSEKIGKIYHLRNPTEVASEVADVVPTATKMDINVEWIDKVLGELAESVITMLYFRKP